MAHQVVDDRAAAARRQPRAARRPRWRVDEADEHAFGPVGMALVERDLHVPGVGGDVSAEPGLAPERPVVDDVDLDRPQPMNERCVSWSRSPGIGG